jgi:hypothetical protein
MKTWQWIALAVVAYFVFFKKASATETYLTPAQLTAIQRGGNK